MAKNFRTQLGGAVGLAASIQQRSGIRLSDVQFVRPSELFPNPLNQTYFADESEEYFEKLRSDVKERGILVPLIAKRNGMLLAGHNRLRIAQETGTSIVPVQFVQDELTEEQETVFVINDNLLRRQLSDEQRFALYRRRYPNFDERLAQRGRPAKISTESESEEKRYDVPFSKIDTQNENNEKRYDVPFPENETNIVKKELLAPLTAKQIAEDTGQTEGAVKQQIKRMRAKELQSAATNIRTADDVDKAVLKKLNTLLQGLETTNEATHKEVVKSLKAFLKKGRIVGV